MPPPLADNQLVFAGENFANGSITGNSEEPDRTLTPGSDPEVFPEGSVVVVSFQPPPDGQSVTRFDVFEDQAAFDAASSLDEADETYFDQNNNAQNAAEGKGNALQTQSNQEGDSFIAYNQQSSFKLNGSGESLPGTTLLFTPNIDILNSGPVDIPVDLNGNGDETFNPYDIVCFAAGTLIATPTGETVVEALKAGDKILTADGRAIEVKWVGRQKVHTGVPGYDNFAPVRLVAGAIAPSVPHTDLTVTADHALSIAGAMVNAGALVNGSTVVRVPAAELTAEMTFYHIETEDHNVIVANGVPAETFVDYDTRRRFDNYDEYVALFGETEKPVREISLPRAMSRRQLPARVREQLDERARALGAPGVQAVA